MENLDEIIKKYSRQLEEMGRLYGEKKAGDGENEANEEALPKVTTDTSQEENSPVEPEISREADEKQTAELQKENEKPLAHKEEQDTARADSFATFSLAAFTGEGAYPVEGARVVVYRGDEIFAFLETDENGRTKSIDLPAFKRENSLQADNPDKSIEFFADVFAEGFIAQRGLLVSSVGGSEILLRTLLVPEGEGIS